MEQKSGRRKNMEFTYEEAVAYLYDTPKFTTKNGLEHTEELVRRLGVDSK